MNEQATQADLQAVSSWCDAVEKYSSDPLRFGQRKARVCRRLLATITALRAQAAALAERVAAQAELLGKQAEKPADVCKTCGGNGCIVFQLGTATCGACNGTGKESK